MFPKIGRYNNLIKTILLFCILLFFSFILLLHFTINLRENNSNIDNNINFTKCCVKDNTGNEFRYSGYISNIDDINTLKNKLFETNFTINNITNNFYGETQSKSINTCGNIHCNNIINDNDNDIYYYTFSQFDEVPVSGYFYGNINTGNFVNTELKKLYLKTIKTDLSDSEDCQNTIISITSNPSTFLNSENLALEKLDKIKSNLNRSINTNNDILNLNNNSPLDIRQNYTTSDAINSMQQYYNNSLQAINTARNPCLIPNQDQLNFSWVGGVARYEDDTRSDYRDNRGWGIRSRDGSNWWSNWNRDSWTRKYYDSASHPNCPTSEYGW